MLHHIVLIYLSNSADIDWLSNTIEWKMRKLLTKKPVNTCQKVNIGNYHFVYIIREPMAAS